MTHDRKRISKFPHMILKSFRITAVFCLFSLKKHLLLNLEPAKVQTEQIFDRFFREKKIIARSKF